MKVLPYYVLMELHNLQFKLITIIGQDFFCAGRGGGGCYRGQSGVTGPDYVEYVNENTSHGGLNDSERKRCPADLWSLETKRKLLCTN